MTPVNNHESIYCTVIILLGLIVNAAVIGNIASLTADLDTDAGIFKRKVDDLEKYMAHVGLPPTIRNQARNFLEYLNMNTIANQDRIINDLPTTLRGEVISYLSMELLVTCPVFEDCSPGLLKLLARVMKSQVFR